MTYGLAIQTPEFPITEEWSWITDIGTSYNGAEDRIPLLRYPRRTFSGNYRFDDKPSLRRHIAMMTKQFRTEFGLPLFQYSTKLKEPVTAGDDTVIVNAKRSDLRVGGQAVVIEGTKYELVEIDTINETSVVFADVLAQNFSKRAVLCPVTTVFSQTGASITRANPDHSATSSFAFIERVPTLPFVSPLNEAVVATFDGLPLLDKFNVGQSFESGVDTGLQAVEYTGLVDIVSPWTYEQWVQQLAFVAKHIGNVDEWEWFVAFAEAIQGSNNPFLFPTNRSDMAIVTPAGAAATTITVQGTEYSDHYQGHGAFSRIFIDGPAGRHYARVTGVAQVGGNDRLTFTPAVPAGSWTTGQRVGFLLKLRNDNDKITCDHYGLRTEIKMTVRTVV